MKGVDHEFFSHEFFQTMNLELAKEISIHEIST
jgi:hypothetical protein